MLKIKNFIAATLTVVLVFSFALTMTACKIKNNDETITVSDMLGAKVEVKKNPQKVACVSRTTYDLLIAFGLGDVIDGVYYSVLDNEWTEVFYPNSVNHYRYQYEESYETFYSRGVDLVFSPEAYLAEGLREHGITAITVCLYGNPSFDSYVFFFANLVEQLWGEREGVSEKVDAWKKEMIDAQTAIQDELKTHTAPTIKPTVFYVRGDKNRGIGYTDTVGSFTEYAYKILGFNFAGSRLNSNRPSQEDIMRINPDVFVIGGIYQETLINLIKTDAVYKTLHSVIDERVYNIPIGFTMFEQLSAFSPAFFYDQANKLYPEYFDFDTESVIKKLSNDFFGVILSDEEVYNMLNGLSRAGNSLI